MASAARIAKLLNAPFAAIFSVRSNGSTVEKLGYHLTEASEGAMLNSEVMREFLKRQLVHLEIEPGRSKHIQLSRESTSIPALREAPHLTFANVSAEVRGGGLGKVAHGRVDYGWVVVATPKPLTPKEEVLFTAVAQRMNQLAEVKQLESAIQLRNQFLSIASHELKTPLTSIYGMLQLEERMIRMKKDDPSVMQPEKLQGFLKMVIKQVERLNELIDGLLNVSRIQSGRFLVEPTDTDVALVLRDVVSSRLEVIAREAGVRLNVESPDSLVAWVDPVRFEEVITNLVMNAIRFSPEGGAVWIKLRDEAEGGSFRLKVRDQGPSVPPEDRERIFQPFERAQRTARLGGLGLGLFISRQIAQLHGGNVSLAESVPGKGNVFEATFPLHNINITGASA